MTRKTAYTRLLGLYVVALKMERLSVRYEAAGVPIPDDLRALALDARLASGAFGVELQTAVARSRIARR